MVDESIKMKLRNVCLVSWSWGTRTQWT